MQCSKNYFKFFLSQEAGASGKNIEKERQKPRPKLKNIYMYKIFAEDIYSASNPIQVIVFWKHIFIL